jgi:peptide/nickel transport system ATP-binding protein
MEKSLLLELDKVRIGFGEAGGVSPVLDGLSLSIRAGEVLGLVGESGSGKSMTALSMMGLLPAGAQLLQGNLWWYNPADGSRINPWNTGYQSIRGRQIGMIFQEPMTSLNPVFSCGYQIEESVRQHFGLGAAEATAYTYDWLEKVQLRDLHRIYSSYPHQLSGGQRQRVMIAMAMCLRPRLLISDESTTALDVTVQAAILDLMQQLQQETHTAILLISHDLGVIGQLADRICILRAGKVVESGDKSLVGGGARHPYTRGLIACRPPLRHSIDRLPTLADFGEEKISQRQRPGNSVPTVSTNTVASAVSPPLMEIRELSVFYGSRQSWWWLTPKEVVTAVAGVSFVVEKGRSIGLVGESGSGKSTLARTLAGLGRPSRGQVLLSGQDIYSMDAAARQSFRRQVQMVFQDPYASLNPALTVADMLHEPLRQHFPHLHKDERAEAVRLMLQQVELDPDVVNRYPAAFSGGQRQRLGIARALICRPAMLICDEAVSALDVSVQAQVLNLLKELQQQQQFSMLFISHDLSVIRFISDELLVMQQGRIVERGSPAEVLDRPAHAYTKQLISAVLEI